MATDAEEETKKTLKPKAKPMGVILQERGLVGPGHIRLVLQDQKVTKEKMGEILMRLGLVSPYDIASIVADQTGYPYVSIDDVVPEAEALRLFNLNICKKNHFLPIKKKGRDIIVVTANDDLEGLATLISRTTGLNPMLILVVRAKSTMPSNIITTFWKIPSKNNWNSRFVCYPVTWMGYVPLIHLSTACSSWR